MGVLWLSRPVWSEFWTNELGDSDRRQFILWGFLTAQLLLKQSHVPQNWDENHPNDALTETRPLLVCRFDLSCWWNVLVRHGAPQWWLLTLEEQKQRQKCKSVCRCAPASLMWYAPSMEANGIERSRIIDILIARPCGDANAVHSLNCMD